MWRIVFAAWLVVACDRDKPPPHVDLTHEHDSAITIAGVRFTTVFALEANEQSPLLVLLHGRGDTADAFRDAWANFPIKLQLSMPLAPLPFGTGAGRQWFEWPPGTGEDVLADVVAAAADKVWPAIEGLAHGRKVMVGGFSQGAMVAYALAVKHPDAVTCAFPIGGRIPGKLVPPAGAPVAPIVALHGTADRMVSIELEREGIAALNAMGASAELHEYPGIGHTITRPMYDQLVTSVRARLR